ncbi:MAG: hypothetical protein ACQES9_01475 [Myxococcota bacterium]
MQILENIAYHFYARGIFSRRKMKTLIRDGYIRYFSSFLYDPMEKELSSVVLSNSGNQEDSWEYENWELDYSSKEQKISKELFHLFESRTLEEDEEEKDEYKIFKKPEIIELKALIKKLHKEIREQEDNFTLALQELLPTSRTWRQAARIISDMKQISLQKKITDKIKEKEGVFSKLWDFLKYDGYLFPDFSGPIMVAYKKITSGAKREQLGRYDWALEHPEIYDIYELIQAKTSISKAFGSIFFEREDVFLEVLKKEFHALAYSTAVLLYSAKRWENRPWEQPDKDEEVPFWISIEELASPAAWAAAWQMNPVQIEEFLNHFFKISLGIQESLYQTMLKSFFDYNQKFERNIHVFEFVEEMKKLISSEEDKYEEDIFLEQKRGMETEPFWSDYMKFMPESRWKLLVKIWWNALSWEALGMGARWLDQEKRWEKRIIDYESYIDEKKFFEQVDPLSKDFIAIFCPKKWNAS